MIMYNVPADGFGVQEVKYYTLDECLADPNFFGDSVYSSTWRAVIALDLNEAIDKSLLMTAANKCAPYEIREAAPSFSGCHWPFAIGPDASKEQNSLFLELFFRRFWITYGGSYIGSAIQEKGSTEEADKKKVYSDFWRNRLIPVLVNTYNKYGKLIELYQAKASSLADRVKSASATRSTFNDTPQERTESDEWANPTHETTLTKSKQENETDFATPMERLDEIRRKLEDIYSLWIHELGEIFIKEPIL